MHSQGFPPIAAENAQALILGTLPGQKSLEHQQYYAHPQNAFWRIMQAITGAAATLPYPGRTHALSEHRIALWDVCTSAFRPGSLDCDIDATTIIPNDFNGFFTAHPHIRLVCFNGAKAAALYVRMVLPGLQQPYKEIASVILPSTSPARTLSFDKKLVEWRKALAASHE